MNRFHLSTEAEKDLEDIWVYLAEQNELKADQTIGQLLDRLPMLAQFPNMGNSRDELLPGLRSFPSKPYLIFYIQQSEHIQIFRIIHQSRDLERLFQ